jgi:hypothetical protein
LDTLIAPLGSHSLNHDELLAYGTHRAVDILECALAVAQAHEGLTQAGGLALYRPASRLSVGPTSSPFGSHARQDMASVLTS